MSSPSIEIVPDVGSIVRLIIRRLVVLPQPDGPTNTVICPVGSSRDSLSTATVPSGKALVTSSNVIIELSVVVEGLSGSGAVLTRSFQQLAPASSRPNLLRKVTESLVQHRSD